MNSEVSILTNNLTKKFGDFTAVDAISFDVKKGEIFGFLGANGAGKTTAIKMLSGLSKPTSGEASIAGLDIYQDFEKIKKRIGYMSQRFSLYEDLTVWENIRFYGGIYGLSKAEIKQRSDELINTLEIGSFRNRLVNDLPLGWKQKLAFSIAIIHQPDIVFLDEPTSGVDPLTRRQFWEMIYDAAAKSKITVLVTTHYLDEAEYCDRVSIMVDGVMRECDTPTALKDKYKMDNMQDVFLQMARRSQRKE